MIDIIDIHTHRPDAVAALISTDPRRFDPQPGKWYSVGFHPWEDVDELTAADFRKSIGNTLPKYMIPVVYHHLPELKRKTNGKIDRLYYSKLVEE